MISGKTILFLCLPFCLSKELPLDKTLEHSMTVFLNNLGFNIMDMYDYNKFILDIESVLEDTQKSAIDMIDKDVAIAQEFARVVKSFGTQANIKKIQTILSGYFNHIEDVRHKAYDQKVDVSVCAFNAVRALNEETRKSSKNITDRLSNITQTLSSYSQQTFVEPASKNLEKTYTVRERIYRCPFSFVDFVPFYLCLTKTAVLTDIEILSQFNSSLNKTMSDIYTLTVEFGQAAVYFATENVRDFNATAVHIFDKVFIPCTKTQGYKLD